MQVISYRELIKLTNTFFKNKYNTFYYMSLFLIILNEKFIELTHIFKLNELKILRQPFNVSDFCIKKNHKHIYCKLSTYSEMERRQKKGTKYRLKYWLKYRT